MIAYALSALLGIVIIVGTTILCAVLISGHRAGMERVRRRR